MAIEFDFNRSSLSSNLKRMSDRLGAAVLMYSSTKAVEIESKMKQNRPWTDRTGMAKAMLNASVSQPDSNTIRTTLAHGVDYGIWLELAHEKNYAIVGPTLEQEAPRVVSELGNLMSNLKL